MFHEIIEKLRQVLYEIEALDDPVADDYTRDCIGKAHDFVEECIDNVDSI